MIDSVSVGSVGIRITVNVDDFTMTYLVYKRFGIRTLVSACRIDQIIASDVLIICCLFHSPFVYFNFFQMNQTTL